MATAAGKAAAVMAGSVRQPDTSSTCRIRFVSGLIPHLSKEPLSKAQTSSLPAQEADHGAWAPTSAPPETAPPPAPEKRWKLRVKKAVGGLARESALEKAMRQKVLRLEGGAGEAESKCLESIPPPCPEKNQALLETKAEENVVEKATRRKRARPEDARSPRLVPLSWQEIEEDLVAMTGRKPSNRLKKRSRKVQAQITVLYPGFSLFNR